MIPSLARKVFNRVGSVCTYTSADGVKTISAFLDLDVAEIGEYGTYVGSRIEIEFLRDDVTPHRGDVAEINGIEYVIESIIPADQANNAVLRVVARDNS